MDSFFTLNPPEVGRFIVTSIYNDVFTTMNLDNFNDVMSIIDF